MKLTYTPLFLVGLAITSFSAATIAQEFYIKGMAGKSYQATDSEPYGENIAIDIDFPSKFDAGDGVAGNLGLGYIINKQFRLETSLGYREGKFSSQRFGTGARAGEEYILKGKLESSTFTVEGFYDINTDTAFTPYVKVGIGVARNEYAARLGGAGVAAFDPIDGTVDGHYDGYADKISTTFTWNVGVGASYTVTDKLSLIGEYQFILLGDATTGQDPFTDGFRIDDATAHEVQLGLRYQF